MGCNELPVTVITMCLLSIVGGFQGRVEGSIIGCLRKLKIFKLCLDEQRGFLVSSVSVFFIDGCMVSAGALATFENCGDERQELGVGVAGIVGMSRRLFGQ